MADFTVTATYEYDNFSGFWVTSPVGLTYPDGPFTYNDTDTTFTIGEDFTGGGNNYMGYITIGGVDYPVVTGPGGDMSNAIVLIPQGTDASSLTFPSPVDTNNPGTSEFMAASMGHCFAAGTLIRTAGGDVPVESLSTDHEVLTQAGALTQVKWVGRQTMSRPYSGLKALNMVQIAAGALGDGLPERDLTVTGDHGMVVDGYVINATALVNGTTITQVPVNDLPTRFTVYHVETENHDVILANGAPSETFIDMAGRKAFDNVGEYLEMYGTERILPEMTLPRIATQRLIPSALKARLGIEDTDSAVDLYSVA